MFLRSSVVSLENPTLVSGIGDSDELLGVQDYRSVGVRGCLDNK